MQMVAGIQETDRYSGWNLWRGVRDREIVMGGECVGSDLQETGSRKWTESVHLERRSQGKRFRLVDDPLLLAATPDDSVR